MHHVGHIDHSNSFHCLHSLLPSAFLLVLRHVESRWPAHDCFQDGGVANGDDCDWKDVNDDEGNDDAGFESGIVICGEHVGVTYCRGGLWV